MPVPWVLYQNERDLPRAADKYADGTYAPRVSVWPAVSPGSGLLLPSAVRGGLFVTAPQFELGGARGVNLILNITAAPGAVTLSLAVFAVSPVLGTTYQFDGGTPVATIAGHVTQIYPGATLAAAFGVDRRLATSPPGIILCQVQHSAAGNWTYSLEYELIS